MAGTSWGTIAIMVPIIAPLALSVSGGSPAAVAATNGYVKFSIQTWNSASGDWNAAKTYTAKVDSVTAGTAIGASVNLPVPTTQNVLVSAVVKTSVGTFALAEVVLAGR